MRLVVNVEEEEEKRSYLKPTTRRPQTNVKVIKTYIKKCPLFECQCI